VCLVSRSATFRDKFPHAWVGDNCIVVGVFDGVEVFLVYVHVPCRVDDIVGDVVCLGSLLCIWDACSIRVAARVNRAISSLWLSRGLSLLCSFAGIVVTLVFRLVFTLRVLFFFLVSWSSHSLPLPIWRQDVLMVSLHI